MPTDRDNLPDADVNSNTWDQQAGKSGNDTHESGRHPEQGEKDTPPNESTKSGTADNPSEMRRAAKWLKGGAVGGVVAELLEQTFGTDLTAVTVEIDTLNPRHSRILSPKTGIVLV